MNSVRLVGLVLVGGAVACGGSSEDATGSTGTAGGSAGQTAGGSAGQTAGGGAGTGQGVGAGKAQGGQSSGGAAGAAGQGAAGGGAGGAGGSLGGSAGKASGGGTSGGGGGATGGTSAGGSPPFSSVVAPAADPSAPSATGVPSVTLAMSKVMLGAEPNATFSFADNLDGQHFTDPKAPGHCLPRKGAKAADIVPDGPKGEDNSFARNVLPIFFGLAPDIEVQLNDDIKSGASAFVVRVRNLGPAASYNGLSVDALRVVGSGSPVSSFGTYEWRPIDDQLSVATGVGDALTAKVSSKTAYTAGNVLVAQEIKDATFPLSFSGSTLAVPLHDARVVATLSPDHASVVSGRLAGIVPAVALGQSLRALAGKISSSLCSGTAIDGVVEQLESAADMMVNGTQDPNAQCDGISFGVGFQALASKVGTSAPNDTTTGCP